MTAPCYSIITVCLNDKEGLARTAQSIRKQTSKDFEWIVVDGRSTDGSVDVVKGDPVVTHLVSEPDEGIYHAMNKGVRLAKGKYCLFLNAGDWLYSHDVLEKAAELLEGDLVAGWLNVIYPEKYNKTPKIRRLDLQDVRKKFLYHRTLHHQATFIRRALFEKFGEYDQGYTLYGDWDFFLRVINSKANLHFIQLCIANYTFDGISSTTLGTRLYREEVKKLRQRHFPPLYRLKRSIIDPIENLLNRRGF
jgi:glycosyltransferase involved in cell wall biosynthesis